MLNVCISDSPLVLETLDIIDVGGIHLRKLFTVKSRSSLEHGKCDPHNYCGRWQQGMCGTDEQ